MINRIIIRISNYFNNHKISKKLHIVYVYCVLVPLIITDAIILLEVFKADRVEVRHQSIRMCEEIEYNFLSAIEEVVLVTNNVYINRDINEFLNGHYNTALDYYNTYRSYINSIWLGTGSTARETKIMMYTDNSTILNGGGVYRLDDEVRKSDWYQFLMDSGKSRVLYIYYDNRCEPAIKCRRKISLISKLDYYKDGRCEQVLKVDMDYTHLIDSLKHMVHELPVYVCNNDKIIFSNQGYSSIGEDFTRFNKKDKVAYQQQFTSGGQEIVIYVLQKEKTILSQIMHKAPIILSLVGVNIILPYIFMSIIRRSFAERIYKLAEVFQGVENEVMHTIECDFGKDEIGILLNNYNKMATKMNDLIQTVYKNKLKEQEINIAKQNAELLALRSQINPHFLFNALESIRMRSVLKEERETAYMIQQLATIERRYVDWNTDYVRIEEEIENVRTYLELQKYRFGEKLSYKLEIDEECKKYYIPQLTIVTFVENACIHGIGSKSTPGWIFIRVFTKDNQLGLEIEDTGSGIKEPDLSRLRERMMYADISALKQKKQVGIINASIRLRMMTDGKVKFKLESEVGVGTIITIKIPLELARC
ncbi:MAG: signal transduction protein [Cellulosilyticum sp.]|nr:signal transduction protein [Cellulosilyticum sp.]